MKYIVSIHSKAACILQFNVSLSCYKMRVCNRAFNCLNILLAMRTLYWLLWLQHILYVGIFVSAIVFDVQILINWGKSYSLVNMYEIMIIARIYSKLYFSPILGHKWGCIKSINAYYNQQNTVFVICKILLNIYVFFTIWKNINISWRTDLYQPIPNWTYILQTLWTTGK